MSINRTATMCLLIVIGGIGPTVFAQRVGQFPQYDQATAGPKMQMKSDPRNSVPLYPAQRLRSSQHVGVAPGLNQAQGLNPQLTGPLDNSAFSIRIKDITTIEGHRTNRLTGIGLVTGLKGTGGKSRVTQETLRNVLKNFDILAQSLPTGSTSLVNVSVEIPAFSRPGQDVTATVSVLDDATGLYGGELLTTPLKGYDGKVYAVAGGSLLLGGFSAGGQAANVSKNHDTAAKVNATVEFEIQNGPAFPGRTYRLLLKNKDYATAQRIATEINRFFPNHAQANDQGSVDVAFPATYVRGSKMDFVVLVNNLRVIPDSPARVVINQKSGTIVVGQNVRLSKTMFAVGNLIVSTTETPIASQPAPFSEGETVVLPRSRVAATETGGRYNIINPQTTVGDLAAALNTLGVTPQDLINVFQTIEASGALQATLVIE
jgi:flagellar P-ring protein precursor FlgI